MAFGHVRRTQTHETEPRNASRGQPGIKDETSRARGRERTTRRGQRQRRGPEEPRMKGCEGVLNETHSTRYHEICSSPPLRTLLREETSRIYVHARAHTYTQHVQNTHTHTDGSRRADWNYGGKDRRFPMTVMITLRWKGVNRISKGRASLKSEPLNTVITSIRACVDFRAQKLAAVKVNSIEKRIAISIGNVNDLGLGYPAFRVSSCASPSLPQRISIYRFWWVDQWPTKSRRAQKFRFFFRRIARPRAEWFGHLLNAKRGVAVGGKMVWESTAAAAAAAAVGLTCCNHQTEKSSNRLLRRGASCRVDKFVFIETLPFPNPPHNGNEHGDPSVKINVLYLRDLIRHQHSFPRRYSHRDVSIQTFFDKNDSLLKLSRNKFFSETNEYKLWK